MSRSEALKETQNRYLSKLLRVGIYFSPDEKPLYDKLQERATKEGKSMNRYIKDLIEKS